MYTQGDYERVSNGLTVKADSLAHSVDARHVALQVFFLFSFLFFSFFPLVFSLSPLRGCASCGAFIYLFIYLFIYWLIYWLICLFVYLYVYRVVVVDIDSTRRLERGAVGADRFSIYFFLFFLFATGSAGWLEIGSVGAEWFFHLFWISYFYF